MRVILFLLRPVYYLLYHHFAWTYDLVAWTVSMGRWNGWVRIALPFLHGRVLELGYGPGHLQREMTERGLHPFGLDESRFMARQASRRLKKAGITPRLCRGLAQSLPFAADTFDSAVATFPAEYIFDPHTLNEVYRVLVPGGQFIIVPMAWVTGTRPLERLVAGLVRVSGWAAGPEEILAGVKTRFRAGRFEVRHELVEENGSRVLVLVAEKM